MILCTIKKKPCLNSKIFQKTQKKNNKIRTKTNKKKYVYILIMHFTFSFYFILIFMYFHLSYFLFTYFCFSFYFLPFCFYVFSSFTCLFSYMYRISIVYYSYHNLNMLCHYVLHLSLNSEKGESFFQKISNFTYFLLT